MFEVDASEENILARLGEMGIPRPDSPRLGVLVASRMTMFLRGAAMVIQDGPEAYGKPTGIIYMRNVAPVQFIKEQL